MKKLQLLKNPAYVYDLMFIFYLKFNYQDLIKEYVRIGRSESELQFYTDVSKHFGDIPDDLYVFFHAHELDSIFLSKCYFKPYRELFAAEYSFRFLQEKLSDRNTLIRRLIKHYFRDMKEDELEACATSLERICAKIKGSQYSNEQKIKLYEFFIEPERHIQLLHDELEKKEKILSEYYEEHYQAVIDLYRRTTYESLCDDFQSFNANYREAAESLYVSYCLLNHLHISMWWHDKMYVAMLGVDYQSLIGVERDAWQNLDLCAFGTALHEESRVKLLNFIVERGEVTCKDVEKTFDFSGSTAYHHLNVMTKVGLIKTRVERKTVLYSLNKGYVDSVIKVLNNIANDTPSNP